MGQLSLVRDHRRRGAPCRLHYAWVVAALVACGGTPPTVHFGAGDTTRVEAPAPSATAYRTDATSELSALGTGREAALAGIREGAGGDSATIVGDDRLAILAGWVAERLGPGGQLPSHEVVEFFAHHLGVVETVHLLTLGAPDRDALRRALADSVRQFTERETYTHFGVTVMERGGLLVGVVALTARHLSMDPVRRRLELGEHLVLRGRVPGAFTTPILALAQPSGTVERLPAGTGSTIEADVALDNPGVYRVELLARGPHGDTVLANFPVYCAIDPPNAIDAEPDAAPGATDPGAVAHELFDLVARERAARGIGPLELDTGLARVAEAHSRDMVEHHFVGHESERTGSVVDRLERAGIRTTFVLENIGRGYGGAEIHRGLLESPGHRANVLHPDATHVGIGVVAEPEAGRQAFVVTQVFVRRLDAVDPAAGQATLLVTVNQLRASRGLSPLVRDADLDRAAMAAAARYFAEARVSQQTVVDGAVAGLGGEAARFSRLAGVMALVSRLDDAATLDPVLDAAASSVGIGVAQGAREDAHGAAAVVFILARPR